MTRHFLDLDHIAPKELRRILELAKRLKAGQPAAPLAGRALAMIFEKPSTRTRVSFQIAAHELGGYAVILNSSETQLGRGETIADTSRVLSRFVGAIMIRTDEHRKLLELARHAEVPVINGLTDHSHPCQVMADLLTFEEHRGRIDGRHVAWVGDANNVFTSFLHAAAAFRFRLHIACPAALAPAPGLLEHAEAEGVELRVFRDPVEAVRGADLVVTDTWVSMGDRNAEQRMAWLEPYRVDAPLMRHAAPDALFMHCLPAHRGEEVTKEVIDGPQSVVFDEAENRLHAQKAILVWCLED